MIICDKCSTELPVDAVACYRCGTMTDVTFVRPIAASPVGKSNQGLMIAGIASVLVLAAAIVIAAMVVSNRASDQTATNRVATTPANTDVQSKASQTPKPAATDKPQSTPAPTPIDVDKQREEYNRQERANSVANAANAMANAARRTAPPNATAQCNDRSFSFEFAGICSGSGGILQMYVRNIDTTQSPRAICGNGGMSYYNGDRIFVCGGGSVRYWYR